MINFAKKAQYTLLKSSSVSSNTSIKACLEYPYKWGLVAYKDHIPSIVTCSFTRSFIPVGGADIH